MLAMLLDAGRSKFRGAVFAILSLIAYVVGLDHPALAAPQTPLTPLFENFDGIAQDLAAQRYSMAIGQSRRAWGLRRGMFVPPSS